MKLFLVLLLGLGWAQLAAAAPAPAALVFAYNAFPPWKGYDAKGQPSGPYTDIVREMARRARLPLQFFPCPLSRCLAAMRQGRADLMIGIQPSAERASYLDFIDPPFARGNRLALFQRRDDPRNISEYQDLLPLTVGVQEGARYLARFDNDKRIYRDSALSLESSLRKLKAGRIDVVIANEQQGTHLASSSEFATSVKRARLNLDSPLTRHVSLAYRAPNYPQKQRLSQALASMLRDGTVERLLAPTRPSPARTRPIPAFKP